MAKFYIVGAGPGAADLLTLRAHKAISTADIILYDRLVNPEIIKETNAELINVGKLPGEQDSGQAKIFELFIKLHKTNKKIVRLKGGDPHIFGRGLEEILFLKELNCEYEYIPGISSATSLAGLNNIPLTARGVSQAFAVVTGQGQEDTEVDWEKYHKVETLIVLMGINNRVKIAKTLIKLGRNRIEPCCFIQSGTLESQQITYSNLDKIANSITKVKAPAVWIIGKVTSFAKEIEQTIEHNNKDKEEYRKEYKHAQKI